MSSPPTQNPVAGQGGYTLTWRGEAAPGLPTDGAWARPGLLGRMDPETVRELPIPVGRHQAPLGELFELSGEPGPRLAVQNAPPLDHWGACMGSGELLIEGDAGDGAGSSMRAGRLVIRGSAGHRVGGPAPGWDRGMTGGAIVVQGSVGDYAGLRMRRGTLAVTGQAGASPGLRMMAGTLAVGCGPYREPGLEMRRGTLVLLDENDPAWSYSPSPFARDGVYSSWQLPIVRLLLRELAELGLEAATGLIERPIELLRGDRFELNRGEIWRWPKLAR